MSRWGAKRQISYLLIVLAFFGLIAAGGYLAYKPTPTCHDGKQNQGEEGTDCGGPCSLVCTADIRPLKVVWARPFMVTKGNYDVAALVDNTNVIYGLSQISYTIRVYDQDNVLLTTRQGATFVNPGQKFVVYESGLMTGERVATTAFIDFDYSANNWQKVTATQPVLNLEHKSFTNEPSPRLDVTVTNPSFDALKNIKVIGVLSDADGNAFAASASVIEVLAHNQSQIVTLTWPTSFTTNPAFIDIYTLVNGVDHKAVGQ